MSSTPAACPTTWQMKLRSSSVICLAAMLAVACGQDSVDPQPTLGPGPESAVAAVEEVHSMVRGGDFDGAATLTIPKHAALASLAEGATFSQVATALRDGDLDVAANFWSGFAQAAGDSFLSDADVADAGPETVGSTSFALTTVVSESSGDRRIVTQDIDGYRIDLFASFGSGLAERMISPVEILLTSATGDATLILTELEAIVDSLQLAATTPGISPDSVQSILQLVELITRVT